MKRDYFAFMPRPDAVIAARSLTITRQPYNEQHLELRSQRGAT